MEEFTESRIVHNGFTRAQCRKGGLVGKREVPFDPNVLERIYPLMPNTWEASYLCVNRVLQTTVQYDVISTGNDRQKIIRCDGVLLPFYNYTQLFDGLRRAATMGYCQE